jgi:hypothetical protein
MSTALDHPPTASPAAPAAQQSYNINDAGKACGLSPSVLRIWELRYGWPNPRRRANGYRAYTPHQVQELKRVAVLVKHGTPISQLIVDGLPKWPVDDSKPQPPRGLPRTRALPRPASPRLAAYQDAVITCLDTRNALGAIERLQRAAWEMRPAEEPHAVLVPIVVAVAEARHNGRPFVEERQLLDAVRARAQQLLRPMAQPAGALKVVPLGADPTTAILVSLILNQRCQAAQVASERPVGKDRWLAVGVGDAPGAVGQVSELGGDGALALAALLDHATLLPWSAR